MNQHTLQNRTIFCRDNIDVLQGINSNSIDLIYLDPPFNKNDTFITKQNKNIQKIKQFFIEEQKQHNRFPDEDFAEVFKDNSASFSDIWTENDINSYYYTQIDKFNNKLVTYLDSIKDFSIKGGFYYLLYMTVRLIEMKRILKDTGSIYYHCDSTFSHYIKAVLDRIFGVENFRNEIVWYYPGKFLSTRNNFPRNHDIILKYSKTGDYLYRQIENIIDERRIKTLERGYTTRLYKNKDGSFKGRELVIYKGNENKQNIKNLMKSSRYTKLSIVENKGNPVTDVFEINILHPKAKERTGYPTQKPLALLERIIKASSNEGDIVLDPFCGCATTCIASENLNRQWIGIDWNKQSFYMIYYRAYLLDILGTEHAPTLFSSGLIQETNIPRRTDVSDAELLQIENERQNKEEIKQTKKIRRMSFEDRRIAKELLYEEQAGICNGCDAYMRSVDLTIDHITPQAQAGDDDLDNLQLLCYRCNNWKRTKDMKYLFDQLYEKNIITKGIYNKQIAKL